MRVSVVERELLFLLLSSFFQIMKRKRDLSTSFPSEPYYLAFLLRVEATNNSHSMAFTVPHLFPSFMLNFLLIWITKDFKGKMIDALSNHIPILGSIFKFNFAQNVQKHTFR